MATKKKSTTDNRKIKHVDVADGLPKKIKPPAKSKK